MKYETTALSNGLPVIISPAPGTPRTAVAIAIRGGAGTQRIPGEASLAARLLLKGTASRTAEEIAEEMDRRAIDLDEASGPEHMMLRATCLNAQLEPALDLMADLLQHSTFADLPKEATILAGEIQSGLDQPRDRARDLFLRTLFPDHPYGHTGSLVLQRLSELNAEAIRDWYYRQLGAESMNLVVVGDVDPAQLLPRLEARFGGIPRSVEALPVPPVRQTPGPVIAAEAKAEANQAQIYQGWYTPGSGSADRAALATLNTVLGAGGLSSRLFIELRDKRGLAYTVRSGYSTFTDIGMFSLYIGTSPDNIRRALEGFAEQIDRLQNEPIPNWELGRAKGHLEGEYVLSHEANSQRCADLAIHHILGLGLDFSKRFLNEILETRPEDLQQAACRYFAAAPLTAVVATREALTMAGV